MTGEARKPRPHPLSNDFKWRDEGGRELRRLTLAERGVFNELGFVKLTDVFMPCEIDSVTEAIDPLEAKGEAWLRDHGGQVAIATADVITFTTHLVRKSKYLRDFAAHPAIKDICHDLVGADVRLYW